MRKVAIAAMLMVMPSSAQAQIACFPGDWQCQHQQQHDNFNRSLAENHRRNTEAMWQMQQQNAAAGAAILGSIINGLVEADRQQRINASLADYEKDVGRTPELRRALLLEAATKYQLLMREPHNVRQSLCDTVRKLHTEYRGSVHACIRAGYLSYQSPKTTKQRRAEKRATEDDWKKRIFGQ